MDKQTADKLAHHSEKLLPCPFCGGAAKSHLIGAWCDNDNCAIVGQIFSGGARHWNERAAPAAGTVEKDAARLAGAKMANTMFNLAQRPGTVIDGALAASMKEMQIEWDAAIEAHTSAGKDATVPAVAGSIRPAPGEQVAREPTPYESMEN